MTVFRSPPRLYTGPDAKRDGEVFRDSSLRNNGVCTLADCSEHRSSRRRKGELNLVFHFEVLELRRKECPRLYPGALLPPCRSVDDDWLSLSSGACFWQWGQYMLKISTMMISASMSVSDIVSPGFCLTPSAGPAAGSSGILSFALTMASGKSSSDAKAFMERAENPHSTSSATRVLMILFMIR